MIRVGIVGIGFMGWIHWLAWQKVAGVQVTAICSRDPAKRSGDWTGIQGNFGPPGQKVDLSGISVYEDFRTMLNDESLDLIDICVPPGMHAQCATDALAAGKHVLCEKPMALATDLCDSMLGAAETHKRQLLVAHVLPFFSEYEYVLQLARKGVYGPLRGGEFKRTISDPTWINGFFDPAIAGGPLIDLLVHDAHFIRALFGMPISVTSKGRLRDETVEYCVSIFDFQNPELIVSCHGGVINQPGRPFTHAFEIRFEQATVQFEFAAYADKTESMPLTVVTCDGQVFSPDLGDGDPVSAFVRELDEVSKVLNADDHHSSILDGRLARDAIELCHAQTLSVTRGDKVCL